MNAQSKAEIRDLLQKFVAGHPSQKQAVAHLKNVSEATVINVLKNNWESIGDDMWRNIGKQVGFAAKGKWHMVETLDFNSLIMYFDDAKQYGNVFGISAPPGSGKTETARWYKAHTQNTFHIVCADYWNRKTVLAKILESMGKESGGYNVTELMDYIIESLLKMENPVLILDEFDKLNEQALCFFITLYNQLIGKCGIVIMGSDHLKKKIVRGADSNRKGYAEIFSRIGRRFIQLNGATHKEVAQICQENGIGDTLSINEIYNEFRECDGDLRRVERAVHKKKLQQAAAANQ